MNILILHGNLTRDPELKHLPSGAQICEFGIAVNESYKDAAGNKIDRSMFIDITVFGRQAEVIAQYLHKGDKIVANGKLVLEQWQAQDGTNRSRHKMVLLSFDFGEKSKNNQGYAQGGNNAW